MPTPGQGSNLAVMCHTMQTILQLWLKYKANSLILEDKLYCFSDKETTNQA